MATRNVRSAAALIAIVTGVGFVIATPALSLFSGASAGQRILKRFTPTFSHAGLTQLSTGFHTVQALSGEFFAATLPAARRELDLSPRRFDARYPAVAAGEREIPPAVRFVAPTIPMIDGSRADFESARTLPAFGLSADATPWLVVGVGAALALLGGLALRRPGRMATLALLGAGAALVAVPLAVSMPSKARAGAHLGDVGRITLSQEANTTAARTMTVTSAMISEVETRLVPGLAARAHTTPAAFTAALARAYPAVGRGLAAWPTIRPQGYALVAIQGASVRDYRSVDAVPIEALPWIVIGPAILLTLVAAAGLAADAAPLAAPRPVRAAR